ncbi:hypothetical protein [Cryobacterium arcticum]|uniref:Nucleotidyl transferase AbiEii/AbiGii toxin family protein n=1 Tax=Cryobacterium arcticum TaxID=670052 RepID=A0A1B1BF88_9MICO|nr:hypothetical protein [Cryobacterium arcticum]ANP71249.1 hypothetical protein PA27867_0275 [Cryobacterium arcticum]
MSDRPIASRPLVNVDARSSKWDEPPWPSAFELARLLPHSSWTLVGGLMVKLHAELSELPAPRTTVDVDSALHLETEAITFPQAAALLQGAGYVLDRSTKHAYRFDRGSERVDLMCADRQLIFRGTRYDGRPLFGIPGGTRALQQTINVDVLTEIDTVRLVVPTVRGALVLKGAAYLADSRARGRHAEDAVVLLACMDDASEALLGLGQQSRGRLRALVKVLNEQTTPWANHDAVVQALARETLDELAELLGT